MAEKTPQAIWCQGNNTLYFINDETEYYPGDSFRDQSVSNVWSGTDVTQSGSLYPKWYTSSSMSGVVERVVFDHSFEEVRPTSLSGWFSSFYELTAIEGIEHLNTSEVTTMNSMFAACHKLTEVEVDGFDMSKVENVSSMFSNTGLAKIYCNKTWSNIEISGNMFWKSESLPGYSEESLAPENFDLNQANPTTGFFTTFSKTAQAIWCEGNKTLYFANQRKVFTNEDTYDDLPVTTVWSGIEVTNNGGNESPAWRTAINSMIERVVFCSSFRDVRPLTTHDWFIFCNQLTTIEGLPNLNTSQTTNMSNMFSTCSRLTEIDVSNFDMSNVYAADAMFMGCSDLTTIYCGNDWSTTLQANVSDMFRYCHNLKGAVDYNSEYEGSDMANPTTGYFLNRWNVTENVTPYRTINFSHTSQYTHGEVIVGVTPETGYGIQTVTVTGDRTGNSIQVNDNGDGTYTFEMPAEDVTVSAISVALMGQMIWCDGNKTIYFIGVANPYAQGETYDGQTITEAFYGEAVSNSSSQFNPTWNDKTRSAERVVFDENFKTIHPKSFNGWFYNHAELEEIVGIENLKTDEATTMNSMFDFCEKLAILNLNTFDMSNVTDTRYMFNGCSDLTTIICYKTWDISQSDDMFKDCTNLVGAIPYDASQVDGSMANPETGYFTKRWTVTVNELINGNVTPDNTTPGTNETVTLTITPRSYYTMTDISVTGELTGDEVELTKVNDNTYTFMMPAENVSVDASFNKYGPYAIYCDDVKTLYFDNGFIPYKGQEYNGHTITDIWTGDAVSNTDWNYPGWMTGYKRDVTKVVFTEAFADVHPTSLYAWFHDMRNLTEIEGLENLNTSQTTIMSGTFSWCFGLTAIDVSGFDVSNVTNTEEMFYASRDLKTIYCNNTWNIEDRSYNMFGGCYSLVGVVAYNDDNTDSEMANPKTGYFTGKWALNIPSSFEHGTVTCEKDWAYTNETVTLTVTPDNGCELGELTVTIVDSEPSGAPLLLRGGSVELTPGEDGTYTFVMPAAPVTVNATFNSPVNYGTLEQLLAGEDIGAINEDLHIGEAFVDDNMVYVADADGNWIGLKVTDDAMTAILESNNKVLKAGTVTGAARDLDTNPVFEVTGVPELIEGTAALPVEINMSEVFSDITGNTLVKISGYYKGNRFTAYQSDTEGQSLAINNTYVATGDLVNNQRYNVCGVLRLKAAWDATSDGAPRRVAASNPDYFKNMEIMPYDIDIVTGVEDIAVPTVKPGQRYNLLGQPVSSDYKGVVIENGRKIIVR